SATLPLFCRPSDCSNCGMASKSVRGLAVLISLLGATRFFYAHYCDVISQVHGKNKKDGTQNFTSCAIRHPPPSLRISPYRKHCIVNAMRNKPKDIALTVLPAREKSPARSWSSKTTPWVACQKTPIHNLRGLYSTLVEF